MADILVSEQDADLLGMGWVVHSRGYCRKGRRINGVYQTLHLHRIVMERMLGRSLEEGEEPDHINAVKTDNRRNNLRLSTRSQNCINSPNKKVGVTGYRGVTYKPQNPYRPYCAAIRNVRHIGYFATALEAAIAYNKAALEEFGEFAVLNAIDN